MTEYVFVYGSLKKGFHNNSVLGNSPLIDVGTLTPKYTMYSLGGFPALVPDSVKPTVIVGELYSVDDAAFKRLDRLEGYPSFYDRKKEMVNTGNGVIEAWVYFIHPENADFNSIVESGVWKR